MYIHILHLDNKVRLKKNTIRCITLESLYQSDIIIILHTTGFASNKHWLKFIALVHLSLPSEKIVDNQNVKQRKLLFIIQFY